MSLRRTKSIIISWDNQVLFSLRELLHALPGQQFPHVTRGPYAKPKTIFLYCRRVKECVGLYERRKWPASAVPESVYIVHRVRVKFGLPVYAWTRSHIQKDETVTSLKYTVGVLFMRTWHTEKGYSVKRPDISFDISSTLFRVCFAIICSSIGTKLTSKHPHPLP